MRWCGGTYYVLKFNLFKINQIWKFCLFAVFSINPNKLERNPSRETTTKQKLFQVTAMPRGKRRSTAEMGPTDEDRNAKRQRSNYQR